MERQTVEIDGRDVMLATTNQQAWDDILTYGETAVMSKDKIHLCSKTAKDFVDGKTSFIPPLQKHCVALKNDLDSLKILKSSLNAFQKSSEYEQVSQFIAIRQMQLEAGVRALTF